MRGEMVQLADLTQRELVPWHELALGAAEPNPFFEPEYVLPLARGLSQFDDVALALVWDHDELVACCPVRRILQWHRVPLPSLSVWHGHPLYSSLGTPLLAGDRAEVAAIALVKLLLARRDVFFTAFDWLDEHGPVFAALTNAFAVHRARTLPLERFQRAILLRHPQPDYLERAMSAKSRSELRRQARRLGEALGVTPEIVERTDEAAVDELIELEAASRLAAGGQVLAANPNHVKFFQDMCRGFAAQNRIKILTLQAAETTLASTCLILADPGIFCHKIAYAERFAPFSPGIQLVVATMRVFHQRPQSGWMDSCGSPTNEMTNRMMTDRRTLVTLAAFDRAPRELVTVPTIRAVRSIRDRVHDLGVARG